MSNQLIGSRRGLLKKAAGLSAVAVGLSAVGTGTAQAAGMAKAAVQYQTKPKDGHQCDGCALFIPGSNPKAVGKCKAVSGKIEPTGWCTLWSPKS
jgi:hypothetical protein